MGQLMSCISQILLKISDAHFLVVASYKGREIEVEDRAPASP
jgi:hypothetical protein